MSESKQCTRCLEVKNLDLFHNKTRRGHVVKKESRCRACMAILNRKENLSPQRLISLAAKLERQRLKALVENLTPEQLEIRREKERIKAKKKRDNNPEKYAVYQAKRRETESYKQWANERAKQQIKISLEAAIERSVGKTCAIIVVNCMECGTIEVKKASSSNVSHYSNMCSSHYKKGAGFIKGTSLKSKEVDCIDCGAKVMGTGATKRCKSCANKYANRSYSGKGSFNARARKYGARKEPIFRLKIYERDRWKCHYCSVKVVRSGTYRLDQATLDHIIALSNGGDHTPDNLVTACMQCNTEKGTQDYHVFLAYKRTMIGANNTHTGGRGQSVNDALSRCPRKPHAYTVSKGVF